MKTTTNVNNQGFWTTSFAAHLLREKSTTTEEESSIRQLNLPTDWCLTKGIINPFRKSGFIFPHYYRMYLNFMYLLLLSPIWVSFKADVVQLRNHLVQKILCFITSGLLATYSVLHVRRKFTAKVKDQPSIIFDLINALLWSAYVFVFIRTVWFKGTEIQFLLEIPRRPTTWRVTMKGLAFICFGLIFGTSYFCLFTLFDEDMMPVQLWDDYSSSVFYMVGLTNSSSIPVTFADVNLAKKVLVTGVLVLDWLLIVFLGFFEILILISSIAIYEIVCAVAAEYDSRVYCGRILLERFAEMKEFIGRINEVDGLFLLAAYIQITTYLSTTLIDVLDDVWKTKIFIVQCYALYGFTLGFAAESHFRIHVLERHIFQAVISENNSGRTANFKASQHYTKVFLNSTPGQTGLTGGRFFLLTYSLIGTTFSILLTYAIVMIQFKATPKPPGCFC